MPDRRYEVRVTGRLSQRARDAFADMEVSEVTAETVITGLVHQDDQLYQLLAVVQSLGLHVVSVQQLAP
jgi:hypothetical protein